MEVKRIAGLSEAECDNLVQTGKIVKELKDSFEAGNIDSLNDETKELLTALNDVINNVLSK